MTDTHVFPFEKPEVYALGQVALADWWTDTVFPRLAKLPGGAIVASPGGGDGRIPRQAPFPRPWRDFSVELNPNAVEQYNAWAKRAGTGDIAVCADALTFEDFPEGIQAVTMPMVLHTLSRRDQGALCRKLAGVLPNGGELFATVPSQESSWRRVALGENFVEGEPNDVREAMGMEGQHTPIMIDFFTRSRCFYLMQNSGYVVLQVIRTQERMGWTSCFGKPEDWYGIWAKKVR